MATAATRRSALFNAGFDDRTRGIDAQQLDPNYMRGYNMAKYMDPRPDKRGLTARWND